MTARALLFAALFFAACSGTAAPPDGARSCESDADCDDGRFCTGQERCAPDDARADSMGCVDGTPPCLGVCDEDIDECPVCGAAADLDGDGHAAILCGGDDCDDDDPDRFPGNLEVCDVAAHDEDCDSTTFGERDQDRDGYFARACCNVAPDGVACGNDCDDTNAGVSPGDGEACDTLDNDCDSEVDEGVPPGVYFRDLDRDGAGDPFARLESCTPPPGYVLGDDDCDDANPGRAPTRVETCNGQDDDCDLDIDEELAGTGSSCTVSGATGACAAGVTVCDASGSGLRCVARSSSSAEVCNGLDDDCDARVDEMVPGIGSACSAPGAVGACAAGTLRCFGASGAMCLASGPAPERCSAVDEDCDGDPIDRGQPGGFECLSGDTRPCSACTGEDGTEACGAECGWSRECNVGGVGTTISWSASDPRFGSNVDGYCWSVPAGSRCCAHVSSAEAYCLTGGGVTLAPASYAVRMFGGSGGPPMTIEIVDITNGTTRATRVLSATGCGPWSERVTFDHPPVGCAVYEIRLRIPSRSDGFLCDVPNVSGIELARTSHVRLAL